MMPIQHIESNQDGNRHNAKNNVFLQMSWVHERSQISLSLGSGIALVHPVGAEVVRDVEHLHGRETHRAQCIVGRLDVRAVVPGATAAVNNDELVPGQSRNSLAQLLQSALAGGRRDLLGARNMRLRVKHVGPDLDDEWLCTRGRLEHFDQFIGVDEL